MSGKQYGIALVGAGVIAPVHTEAISALPNARLVAVCDVVKEKADELAAKYGAQPCYDLKDVLARGDVDIVDVVVWSGRHAQVGVEAARAGKHVFVTKPIDVTLEAIDRLIEACEDNQVKLGAVHQFRSYPSYRAAKQAVSSGAMGKMVIGNTFVPWYRAQSYYDGDEWRGTWRWDGGGALMNQGVHYVDLIQWIMGGVKEVFAYADIAAHHERIEVEDVAVAAVRFLDGSIGTIQASTSIYKGLPARMDLHGEKGNIFLVSDEVTYWDVEGMPKPEDTGKGASVTGAADPRAALRRPAVDAHVDQIAAFIRAIEEGGTPMIDGREARKAVEVNLAIYRSAREGRPVSLPL
ncbi:MAG: Gfo/Idh/MocA family oxidoreductase [Anaerolineae bacterium]|nr:Gfo/Idh/MocA family oxidoreductase [Anaerolineae bacterium]